MCVWPRLRHVCSQCDGWVDAQQWCCWLSNTGGNDWKAHCICEYVHAWQCLYTDVCSNVPCSHFHLLARGAVRKVYCVDMVGGSTECIVDTIPAVSLHILWCHTPGWACGFLVCHPEPSLHKLHPPHSYFWAESPNRAEILCHWNANINKTHIHSFNLYFLQSYSCHLLQIFQPRLLLVVFKNYKLCNSSIF